MDETLFRFLLVRYDEVMDTPHDDDDELLYDYEVVTQMQLH